MRLSIPLFLHVGLHPEQSTTKKAMQMGSLLSLPFLNPCPSKGNMAKANAEWRRLTVL